MSRKSRINDPHADREAAKYDSPIPSREFIIDLLQEDNSAWSFNKLCKMLQLHEEEQEIALLRRLKAMMREGQLTENDQGLFILPDRTALIAGKVMAHKDGYGFVLPEGGGEDLFLHYREMRKVFDGDKVLARVMSRDKKGKLEGEIVEVTERNTHRIVGKLFIEENKQRVVPDNPKIQHTVYIDQQFTINAEHETIVVVEITRQPDAKRPPQGVIVEILGNEMAPGMEIQIATRTFGIPYEWPAKVLEQAEKFSPEPTKKDKLHRVDIRDLPLVTIDGEDARDFDDAVYCEKKPRGGGWRLIVAIADVSHYVSIGTALDDEARLRSTSVYFPENVIPMLPEQLSNGLCSLKPAVDRLCMVCDMQINAKGIMTGYEFYEGVMHSHARLTYTEVGRLLQEKEDPDSLIRGSYAALVPHIDELHNLYHALRSQRLIRGAIDFETTETRIIFNEQRKIESIIPVVRNDAHKLIEECMLCANVATANFLEKHKIPALYRSHEGPTEKRLGNLQNFIGELGLTLTGGAKPGPLDYQTLFQQVKDRVDANLIQTMMLRSMSQAVYEPDNKGHFGLAYEAYTHFTSPIRRYPDLLVHRAIRSVIRSDAPSKNVRRVADQKPLAKDKIYPYTLPDLIQLGEHCSMAERRADDATRDVNNWLKCEYLQAHLGDTFDGIITSVTGFGFFVELSNLYAEGLVHVSQLGSDFFVFDAGKQRLIGERTRLVFRIGDKVSVIITGVDLKERKVNLSLAGKPVSATNASGKSPVNKQAHKGGATKKHAGAKASASASHKPAGKPSGKSPAKPSGKPPAKKPGKSSTSKTRKRR
jgi:ribonuclease R